MSKAKLAVEATNRSDIGKGASRRLRRLNDLTPAVVYGNNESAVSITIDHKKIYKALENEAFHSSILDLSIDGKTEKVVLKAVQRHPYKKIVQHVDFQRISDKHAITMHVPLHYLNTETSKGLKAGGILSQHYTEIEVKCLPKDLPEFIEVDLSEVDLDTVVHISDVKLPKGVEATLNAETAVAAIHKPKSKGSDTEEADASSDAAKGDA